MSGRVLATARNAHHSLAKGLVPSITLRAGHGVEGDVHAGATVKHRSRVAVTPESPNLRQVHLIHAELHRELRARDFVVTPGAMGENVTTEGIDLLALPRGTRLRLGAHAIVEVTGLRNPCSQLDAWQPGLMEATLERLPDGSLARKAGIMSVVVAGGDVRAGDAIEIDLPPLPHVPLERV